MSGATQAVLYDVLKRRCADGAHEGAAQGSMMHVGAALEGCEANGLIVVLVNVGEGIRNAEQLVGGSDAGSRVGAAEEANELTQQGNDEETITRAPVAPFSEEALGERFRFGGATGIEGKETGVGGMAAHTGFEIKE